MSDKKSPFKETKELFNKAMRDRKLEKVKFKWKRSLIMIACGIFLYFQNNELLRKGSKNGRSDSPALDMPSMCCYI